MADISAFSSLNYFWLFNNINNLSDDLLGEIFIRLPFRSTVKCKCVCKRWFRLISSLSFQSQFVSCQHSLCNAYLTFLSPHQLMFNFFLPDLDLNTQTQKALLPSDTLIKGNVCGYSNGLFLCCSNRYTRGQGYFVYDPLTKESAQIFPSPEMDEKECMYAVGFLSESYYSGEEEGQTSLNCTRYFWVVIVKSFIITRYRFEVVVFSSETGMWENISVLCIDGFAFAPHWMLSLAHGGNLYFMGKTSIFVYDPVLEHGDTINYPEGIDAMNVMSFGYLGCSGGTLRIADIGHSDLRMWELKYQDTWHLVHKTNLATYLPIKFCDNYYKRIGGFHPYDGDIVYLHSYVDGLFTVNLKTNKFEPIPGCDKLDISPFQLRLPLPPPIPSTDKQGKTQDPSDNYEVHAYFFTLNQLITSDEDDSSEEEPEDT